MMKRGNSIALLHHTGGGNLGDDATIDAVVHNIRQRRPLADIVIFSMNPLDTALRHGVPSEPIRRHTWGIGYEAKGSRPESTTRRGLRGWLQSTRSLWIRPFRAVMHELVFLARSFRKLRKFDSLVVTGGGQLTERSGPWGFPYSICVWTIMAKAAGLRCTFLSVGAGPLKHPLSRFFVARSLNTADYVSFRDVESQALAQEVGFRGQSLVFPDNAYSLPWSGPGIQHPSCGRAVVGLAPMPFPFCDPREYASGHQQIYDEYILKFATFAADLAADYHLEMFGSDAGVDGSAIEDMRGVLQKKYDVTVPPCDPIHSVEALLLRMSAMDYIVTCRFHGVLLAHVLNKPVLAIAHHPKITYLMRTLGLGDYCVDIRNFAPQRLTDSFAALVRHNQEIRKQMAVSLAAYKSRVAEQFDLQFPLLDDICGRVTSDLTSAGVVSGIR